MKPGQIRLSRLVAIDYKWVGGVNKGCSGPRRSWQINIFRKDVNKLLKLLIFYFSNATSAPREYRMGSPFGIFLSQVPSSKQSDSLY